MEKLEIVPITKKVVGDYFNIDGEELDILWNTIQANYRNFDDVIWDYIKQLKENIDNGFYD